MPSIRFDTRERNPDGVERGNAQIPANRIRVHMMGFEAKRDYTLRITNRVRAQSQDFVLTTDSGGSYAGLSTASNRDVVDVLAVLGTSYQPVAPVKGPWQLVSSSAVSVEIF